MTLETFVQSDEKTWPDLKGLIFVCIVNCVRQRTLTIAARDNPGDLWLLRHWLQFLTISDNIDNPRDFWLLRHWLQFWQLRTWIQSIILTWQLIVTLDSIRNSMFIKIYTKWKTLKDVKVMKPPQKRGNTERLKYLKHPLITFTFPQVFKVDSECYVCPSIALCNFLRQGGSQLCRLLSLKFSEQAKAVK